MGLPDSGSIVWGIAGKSNWVIGLVVGEGVGVLVGIGGCSHVGVVESVFVGEEYTYHGGIRDVIIGVRYHADEC